VIILLFKGVLTATYIEILKEFNEELIKERSAPVIGSNRIIQSHNTHLIVLKKLRDKYITNLEKITNRKTIIYYSGFLKLNPVSSSFGMSSQSRTNDMHISINDQDINAFSSNIFSKISKSTLSTNGYDIVLHTPGGAATSCEQLIQTITAFCDNNFRTIIPQQAMSAGTMIACASKEIIMDDSAALGPTDPQV
jgi:ClpP class serine protease